MKKLLTITGLIVMCSTTSVLANDAMMKKDSMMMTDMHIKMMDTNGDGMVSKDEHAAGAEKMFMKADTSGDGMVSKDEMMAMKMKEMKDMSMMKKDGMMMKDDKMMMDGK